MPCTILLALALAATDRHPITRHEVPAPAASSSGGFWLGAGGIAVALAAFGAVSLAARKARPRGDSADLRVVGRASLSPRHAVYLLRVGDRTLIVGTGGQGAPSLLGELTPSPETPSPIPHQAARLATTIGGHA